MDTTDKTLGVKVPTSPVFTSRISKMSVKQILNMAPKIGDVQLKVDQFLEQWLATQETRDMIFGWIGWFHMIVTVW